MRLMLTLMLLMGAPLANAATYTCQFVVGLDAGAPGMSDVDTFNGRTELSLSASGNYGRVYTEADGADGYVVADVTSKDGYVATTVARLGAELVFVDLRGGPQPVRLTCLIDTDDSAG